MIEVVESERTKMITIQFLGQCGFLLETEKLRVAIDPVLNALIEDGRDIRCYPPVMAPKDLRADYIFCTHDHIDHMPKETLVTAVKDYEKTKIVVPAGCMEELVSWGISKEKIIGMADKEERILSEKLSVKGISAAHPVHSTDEKGQDHNLVYCIELEGKKLVHLGDTYRTPRLVEGLTSFGAIDVLFPPINGRDEIREAKGIIGNLSCREAAELAKELQVGLVIPTHFDMVVGNTEDPENFVREAKALAMENYWIPKLDEKYKLL